MKAFPCGEGIKPYEYGMDLRDYFAAKALQGMLADHTQRNSKEIFAKEAYQLADEMMKAREK